MERPLLSLDLSGPEGNVFVVIGRARALLTGLMLEHFNTDIGNATLIDAGKTYVDILAIVNQYTQLVDSSGMYADYAKHIDEQAVTAAVDHFNARLQTLPPTVVCAIDGLYPDFEEPDTGPEVYLSFVEDEIRWVVSLMAQKRDEHLDRLLTILQELVSALRRAGVE
jgi:hypothetical protein